MPTLDQRSCDISSIARSDELLNSYAEEFYFLSKTEYGYPTFILEQERKALASGNKDELIMMADATSQWPVSMYRSFNSGLAKVSAKQARYEYFCVAAAAFYAKEHRYWLGSPDPFFPDIVESFANEFDAKDLERLRSFIECRRCRLAEESAQREAALEKEREEKERLELIRAEERSRRELEASLIKQKEMKQRQIERSNVRLKDLERFAELPLEAQIREVISNNKGPQYYGGVIPRAEDAGLEALPKRLLLDIILSYRDVKDAGWRRLQKKAEEIITE